MANDELVERLHKALSKCPINGSFSKGSLADYLNPILSTVEPLIRADERERCARVADVRAQLARGIAPNDLQQANMAEQVAAAIRNLTTEAKDG